MTSAAATFTLKTVLLLFKYATRIKNTPYVVSSSTRLEFRPIRPGWETRICYIIYTTIWLTFLFQISNCFMNFWLNGLRADSAIQFFFVAATSQGLIFYTVGMLNPREMVGYVNELWKVLQQMEGRFSNLLSLNHCNLVTHTQVK